MDIFHLSFTFTVQYIMIRSNDWYDRPVPGKKTVGNLCLRSTRPDPSTATGISTADTQTRWGCFTSKLCLYFPSDCLHSFINLQWLYVCDADGSRHDNTVYLSYYLLSCPSSQPYLTVPEVTSVLVHLSHSSTNLDVSYLWRVTPPTEPETGTLAICGENCWLWFSELVASLWDPISQTTEDSWR